MSQSVFLVGSLIVAFIAWTVMLGTFPLYLSALGLGGAAPPAQPAGGTAAPGAGGSPSGAAGTPGASSPDSSTGAIPIGGTDGPADTSGLGSALGLSY